MTFSLAMSATLTLFRKTRVGEELQLRRAMTLLRYQAACQLPLLSPVVKETKRVGNPSIWH